MKTKWAAKYIPHLFIKVDFEASAWIRLSMPSCQLGLGIKQIHLAWPAMLEQADNGLRFGRTWLLANFLALRQTIS
jgi:hypothetical protein